MKEVPRSAIAVQVLILIIAGFWLVFSLVSALGGLPGQLAAGPVRWVMAAFSFGAALVLGLLVFLLNRRKKWAFFASLLVLTIIGVLSITDEVGLLDLVSLIISLAAIVLLLVSRSWYFGPHDVDVHEIHE